jgi:hypothetical protein
MAHFSVAEMHLPPIVIVAAITTRLSCTMSRYVPSVTQIIPLMGVLSSKRKRASSLPLTRKSMA